MPPIHDVEYRLLDSVLGAPGYRVGSDGSVWTRRTRERYSKLTDTWTKLVQRPSLTGGYLLVHVLKKQIAVHLLVLKAFSGPRPPGMEARHFPDRNVANNRSKNLRWGTKEENCADKVFHGTNYDGERHHSAVLTVEDVRFVRQAHVKGVSQRVLALVFGVKVVAMNRIIRRVTWKPVS